MQATLEEVKTLIEEGFPRSDVSQIAEDGHRITGVIYWEDFREMKMGERTQLVTKRVRDKLGLKGLNVGILFPLARGEKL